MDGLSGNIQAEPRILTHDAATVVIGAINASDANKGLTITSGGTGYSVGDTLTYNAGSVAGTGLVLTVLKETGGVVTDFTVTTAGSLYLVGESLTFTGGANNFTADVSNIDIPNTQRRGCCLYSGASQTVQVELESGNTVSFVGVNAGSFLPILAKRLVTGTNIVALY